MHFLLQNFLHNIFFNQGKNKKKLVKKNSDTYYLLKAAFKTIYLIHIL